MGVISIVNGDYNPTNITMGAPPCSFNCFAVLERCGQNTNVRALEHELLVLFCRSNYANHEFSAQTININQY